MSGAPLSPRPPTHALDSQVGGHRDAVLTTEDNTLLIKQALPLELQFYQTVAVATEPEIDALRPFIPKFLGTLALEGELDTEQSSTESNPVPVKPIEGPRKESIVLENLANQFLKPNILDIKLGTVLYDELAPPDKVVRMKKTAESTTSLKTGMRLTAFQVYDNLTGSAITTDKTYGKSLSPSQLPEGIARFFPIRTQDKPSQGLPAPLLLQILQLLRDEIQDILNALAVLEIRIVGGSLLILYESDVPRAEEGLKWMGEEEEEDEESDNDSDIADGVKKPGPPCDVRLIDFAHTRFVPGQGPDEGVLLGLRTVLSLLDERIKTVGDIVDS